MPTWSRDLPTDPYREHAPHGPRYSVDASPKRKDGPQRHALPTSRTSACAARALSGLSRQRELVAPNAPRERRCEGRKAANVSRTAAAEGGGGRKRRGRAGRAGRRRARGGDGCPHLQTACPACLRYLSHKGVALRRAARRRGTAARRDDTEVCEHRG